MDKTLVVKNFVLIGEFQPYTFDKFFFIKHGILKEEDFLPGSVFQMDGCLIQTEKFTLTITPTQIIFNEQIPLIDAYEDFQTLARLFVENSTLATTALGINFHWYIFYGGSTKDVSEQYFSNPQNPVNQFFKTENTSYGYYLSKDFMGARLKLDMKPGIVADAVSFEEVKILMFAFNFHVDINKQKSQDDMLDAISKMPDFFSESKNIMSIYG